MVCIIWEPIGNCPMQTNNQTASDLHWNLYKKFVLLRDQTVVEMVKVPAVSDTYQQLKGRRELLHNLADHHLEMWKQAC